MLSFAPAVRVAIFPSRLYDVLALSCDWSLKSRVNVQLRSVEDAPSVDRLPTLRGLELVVELTVALDTPPLRKGFGDYLRRHLDTTYEVVTAEDHVRVEWGAHLPPRRAALS